MLVSVIRAPSLQAEQSVNATPQKVPPGQAEQSTVLVPPSTAETCMVTPRTYSVVSSWHRPVRCVELSRVVTSASSWTIFILLKMNVSAWTS